MARFTPDLFRFLRDLARHNDQDWFRGQRSRYEADVLDPALDFVSAFGDRLAAISPHFVADARRSGGSVFRIHRDVRFSRDKRPYKTHLGIHFRHRHARRDVHAPGFYLHLEPRRSFVGVGIWRPSTAVAYRVREAIGERPDAWIDATRRPPFSETFRLEGETLVRAPAGSRRITPSSTTCVGRSSSGCTRSPRGGRPRRASSTTSPRRVGPDPRSWRTSARPWGCPSDPRGSSRVPLRPMFSGMDRRDRIVTKPRPERAFEAWYPVDEMILRAMVHSRRSVEEIARRLRRTTPEVAEQLQRLGLA